jgi:hypothetical protein
MSIKVNNLMLSSVTIPEATIRINRIFGSSKEHWNALVEICVVEETIVPEVQGTDAVGFPGELGYVPEVAAIPSRVEVKYNVVYSYNIQVEYVSGIDCYNLLYAKLMTIYPEGSMS